MCNNLKTHNAICTAPLLKDKEIPLLYFLNVLHLPVNVSRSVWTGHGIVSFTVCVRGIRPMNLY